MTPDDAAQILALLGAAWPHQRLEEPTIALWLTVLGPVDIADARAAAGKLITESKFFPSIAEFSDAAGATRRAREHRQAANRGLPRPTGNIPSPERMAEIFAACRDKLSQRGSRGHWHGGPDPCSVCGGLQVPTKRPRQDKHPGQRG